MHNNAQVMAKRFRKEYRIQQVSLDTLKQVLQKQGYTLVEFNNVYNEAPVAALVTALELEEQIATCRGFTYADRLRRLVFLNEDLSAQEKLVVLAHEAGHIYCGHFSQVPILGRDVVQEHEANEFAHYLLKPSLWQRCKASVARHKKAWIAGMACLVVAAGVLTFWLVQRENRFHGDFYLTSTGNKYHRQDCGFVKDKTNTHRMTQEEYESGEYEACGICKPEEP